MDRQRLDYLVAQKLNISRSAAVSLIETGKVKVNGRSVRKSAFKTSEDSDIEITESKPKSEAKLNFKIIYEDDNCVVVDKPAGILAHSKGAYSDEKTVASWLLPRTKGFEHNNNRAGIVHRLDRGTSGVMICAKNPQTLLFLQKQFSSRKVKKVYDAVIDGFLDPDEAIIDIPIMRNPKDPKRFKAASNGKSAQTHYKVVESFTKHDHDYSLVRLTPKTGRTHQLRVHLAYLGRPILGDDFYEGKLADRLYLHAESLEITIPGSIRKVFTSSLPKQFKNPKIPDNG